MQDGKPVILIEAKWIGEKLEKHDSQLFRYFATCKAKFAILTNGQYYRFYTDLEEPNKMDETPFLDIDLLALKETQVVELKKSAKKTLMKLRFLTLHLSLNTPMSSAKNSPMTSKPF